LQLAKLVIRRTRERFGIYKKKISGCQERIKTKILRINSLTTETGMCNTGVGIIIERLSKIMRDRGEES